MLLVEGVLVDMVPQGAPAVRILELGVILRMAAAVGLASLLPIVPPTRRELQTQVMEEELEFLVEALWKASAVLAEVILLLMI
jgi:hypothetical protein